MQPTCSPRSPRKESFISHAGILHLKTCKQNMFANVYTQTHTHMHGGIDVFTDIKTQKREKWFSPGVDRVSSFQAGEFISCLKHYHRGSFPFAPNCCIPHSVNTHTHTHTHTHGGNQTFTFHPSVSIKPISLFCSVTPAHTLHLPFSLSPSLCLFHSFTHSLTLAGTHTLL